MQICSNKTADCVKPPTQQTVQYQKVEDETTQVNRLALYISYSTQGRETQNKRILV